MIELLSILSQGLETAFFPSQTVTFPDQAVTFVDL